MLTKDSFMFHALKAYDNPTCKTLIEFEEDLSRFSNLVRLTKKDVGPIETHVLLNTVMTILNAFENEEAIKLMFFKVKPTEWSKLKTILTFLNRMPEQIPELGVLDFKIPLNQEMDKILRCI